MTKIKISEDFSVMPGGRYIDEGKYSGEEFRDTLLLPKYEEAEENGEKLIIDFDGCFGFATSFLEEAFGGMVRKYNKIGILKRIEMISRDDETVPETISGYVKDAEKKVK